MSDFLAPKIVVQPISKAKAWTVGLSIILVELVYLILIVSIVIKAIKVSDPYTLLFLVIPTLFVSVIVLMVSYLVFFKFSQFRLLQVLVLAISFLCLTPITFGVAQFITIPVGQLSSKEIKNYKDKDYYKLQEAFKEPRQVLDYKDGLLTIDGEGETVILASLYDYSPYPDEYLHWKLINQDLNFELPTLEEFETYYYGNIYTDPTKYFILGIAPVIVKFPSMNLFYNDLQSNDYECNQLTIVFWDKPIPSKYWEADYDAVISDESKQAIKAELISGLEKDFGKMKIIDEGPWFFVLKKADDTDFPGLRRYHARGFDIKELMTATGPYAIAPYTLTCEYIP